MIQKNAQKYKQIIKKWFKWKVGNGRIVLFWDGVWILDHPLSADQRWNGFMEQCKNLFGIFVEDYWEENKWLDFKRVDRNLIDLNKILDVVLFSHEEDEMIQKYNPNGVFSMHLVYANAFEEKPKPFGLKLGLKV